MKIIIPKDSPKAGGHYSPGVISNGMLYISGQLPVDPETGNTITGDVSAHALRALQNMELILIAAGLSKENVVLCRVYISDVALWANVNSVYASFLAIIDQPEWLYQAAHFMVGRWWKLKPWQSLKLHN